ncbi:hypothetical protein BJV77DRAFT_1059170 [Russula vinacea]|nr:hypothetical protein BJV77DRAFT_1059170 [Russula vinacea]
MSPDPAARQPFTNAAFFPLYSCHYVLAVLAILPRTFVLKLVLLPIVVWQAWKCAVGLDFAAGMANSMGVEGSRLRHFNFLYVVGVFTMVLRSLAWTFAKKPLRRYDLPAKDHAVTPVERPLSIPNVLLDALDLICNLRGIGWSWSPKPFTIARVRPPPTIPTILGKLLLKLVAFDVAHYLVQHFRPSVNRGPALRLGAFFTLCGGMVVYTTVDALYHLATLIGRILLRQPAWRWPPLSDRPWTATSITEFWSFRWHQFFRHVFIVFGSQPGGALLGRPGALVGAFAVSGVMHDVGMWGLGRGTEFRTVFRRVTGRRVGGLWGWAWTMVWTVGWGSLMIDAWARRGMIASDFFPYGLRPGKPLVDAIISLSR